MDLNQLLMIVVLGGLLLLILWLIVSSFASLAAPASSGLRGVFAKLICPETHEPTEVRLGIARGDEGAVPVVLACERFGAGPVTCDQACLEPTEKDREEPRRRVERAHIRE